MKKRRNISRFLILVSIIMLAATVFPHHHHQHRFCWQQDITTSIESCAISDCCAHNHSADSESNPQPTSSPCDPCCVTVFHVSAPDDAYDSMEPHYSLTATLFTLIDFLELTLQPEEENTSHYTFFYETLHSRHLTKAAGLRAPPSFIA